MEIRANPETFRLAETFAISRGSRDVAEVLTVCVEEDGRIGWGECVPYARYGESMESVADQVMGLPSELTREGLQETLPAGAARNAVDCALWDLAAKQAGERAWRLAGIERPGPVVTAFTLSLDTPERMEASARRHAGRPLLKVKLGGEEDMSRLEAVRRGAPETRLIVDANEGWSAELYSEIAWHLVRLGVQLVEQPLPAGNDGMLAEIERPLPVCADESVHDRATLPALMGKYDAVNIKLDKTGGLTEALALRDAAREQGHDIMAGCMVGTSLAMAPAILLAQGATVVDLDGPLLLAEDRDHALEYEGGRVHPPRPELWG
ncbi:MAG: dipeptide epimerase [Boseongicola sp. SB0675_bin_26]|nr:dipeptide epimerase [Boseongicola sp. SB0675_bin_26]